MIEMTLSSRHRIQNSSPGGLRPSTLPLGHGGSPHTAGAWPYRVLSISYSVYVVILGVCLSFNSHWMFQIYKYVIKGREELTSHTQSHVSVARCII